MPVRDISGMTFGRLTAVACVGRTISNKAIWRCVCSCGNEKDVVSGNLTSGQIVSCGCFQKESRASRARVRSYKHGHAVRGNHTSEYRSYRAMLTRCSNPNTADWKRYGGRGIHVCQRWLSGEGEKSGFECFLADMGQKPSPEHSIDRWPNGDGNYEPSNCRWATPKQQGGNGVRKADQQDPIGGRTELKWLNVNA
jgi:hypothetical protein